MEVLWVAGPTDEDRIVSEWLRAHGHAITPVPMEKVDRAFERLGWDGALVFVEWAAGGARVLDALRAAGDGAPDLELVAVLDRASGGAALDAAVEAGVTDALLRPHPTEGLGAHLSLLLGRAQRLASGWSKQADATFHALVDSSFDPISIHRDRVLVYVNPAGLRALRFPSLEAAVGRSIYDFLPPEDHEGIERLLQKVERDGVPSRPAEQRFVCYDGSSVLGETYAFPVHYRGARCLATLGRDLTEVRRLESQLRHAERLATLGTMTAGIAHDLNNPLAYVIANLADLGVQLPALAAHVSRQLESFERRIDAARAGAERLSQMTHELLAFASPRDEGVAIVDLRAVAAEALRLASSQLRRAEVTTEWGPIPKVRGSELRLVQALLNLLINAGHAVSAQANDVREVRVRTYADRGDAIVEVRDTGVGIPADVLPKIFEPFFTTREASSGTGLGLAVASSIVRELGGVIEVESREGAGATFRVRLPPADEAGARAGRVAAAAPKRSPATPGRG